MTTAHSGFTWFLLRRNDCAALARLWNACQFAALLNGDVWQFAIPLKTLVDEGLELTEVRFLVELGVLAVKPQIEREPDKTCFGETSMFVFSPECARSFFGPLFTAQSHATPDSRPWWDGELRELWYRDCLVKRYRVPAPNQELILEAFHEEGWPKRIDDPLPPCDGLDPKQRLRDSIKALNRNRKSDRLRFLGDGNSEGVVWEDRTRFRSRTR
jgi:hypothetical protein